jgi:hypothetical protein
MMKLSRMTVAQTTRALAVGGWHRSAAVYASIAARFDPHR